MKKTVLAFGLLLSLSSQLSVAEDIAYILTAAAKGDLSTVKAMLQSGVNANTKDVDDISALMYAARKDRADVVSTLISKGADVNAKDKGGWTALMFAARKNYIKTVTVLLDKGADPKIRDESGWSAFGMASTSGFSEIVNLMIKKGVDSNAKNDDGKTPSAFEKGQYEILNFTSANNNKSLTIKLASTIGKNYISIDKNVSVLIHNIKVKRIFVNGQEQFYKTFQEPLQVNVTMTKGTTQELKIEY